MSGTVGNQLNIPIFIKARTPELLVKEMLKNNAKDSMEYAYFDIQFVKGTWYAWFKKNLRNELSNNKEIV